LLLDIILSFLADFTNIAHTHGAPPPSGHKVTSRDPFKWHGCVQMEIF